MEGAPRTQVKGSFMLGRFDFDPENIHCDSGDASTHPPCYLEISIWKKGHIGHRDTGTHTRSSMLSRDLEGNGAE